MAKKYIPAISAVMMLTAVLLAAGSMKKSGEKIFREKCSTCHSLKNPASYSAEQWKYHVERMSKRAGLTSIETSQIIDLKGM